MIGLEDLMAAQETELISAGAAREVAEQGHQRLEAESQKLRSAYNGEFLSTLHYVSVLPSHLVTNPLFLYRVAHMGTLGSRGEGGHELEGARDGHLAGRANLL
jgi:hypothetical protein